MEDRAKDTSCNSELLEQWKACVESADRISQRRDAANGLFTTLGIGVLTASTAIGGCKSIPLLVVGIGICVVWLLYISSFKTLNDAKFAVIDSMESQMQSRPFADEWKRLTGSKKYNKQTTIEKALPVLFCFVFLLNDRLGYDLERISMQYNLFISHSWTYSDQYQRLINLLDSKYGFNYRNYSVPKDNPIHNAGSDYLLRQAIERQMKPASCVIILAGVYSTYSKWINIEIELARKMGKKIIAVEPWGSERTSAVVKNAADEIVRWNSDSIVRAIRGF